MNGRFSILGTQLLFFTFSIIIIIIVVVVVVVVVVSSVKNKAQTCRQRSYWISILTKPYWLRYMVIINIRRDSFTG